MRVLFLSSNYATPLQPRLSIGNTRIVHAMRAHADVRVIAPIHWFPPALVRRRPELYALTQVPSREVETDGATVLHPRTLHLPRVGRVLYAGLYAASVAAPLLREVRAFAPDALLSAWAYPDGTAAVALGKLLGLPTVVRVMGSDINTIAKLPGRRAQIAWAMRRAGRVISVSRGMADELERLGVDRARIAVVPTGVDAQVFAPRDQAAARRELGLPAAPAPVVVYAGRLSPEKGVRHLIDALPRLPRADVHAVLVGDGPERGALEAQVGRAGLGARVRFAGHQPEGRMAAYYSAADVACLPSLQEGWPDAVMESFACGCPLVASAVGGVPDIVALTGAGLLVPPADPARLAVALAEALERAWDRPALVRAMAGYTLDETARRYLGAIEAAMALP